MDLFTGVVGYELGGAGRIWLQEFSLRIGGGWERNPFTLLVGMQTSTTTLEKNLEAS
jgi:hypothetical protein